MSGSKDLVSEIAAHIKEFIPNNITKEYYYHNLRHTISVVEVANEIGVAYQLSATELEVLALAAWFHDTGYIDGREQHEERSAEIATLFLSAKDYSKENTHLVAELILTTKIEEEPKNLLQKIIKDADLNHLGTKESMQHSNLLRSEWEATEHTIYTDEEWYRLNIAFAKNHSYLTPVAKTMFQKQKLKNTADYQQLLDSLIK